MFVISSGSALWVHQPRLKFAESLRSSQICFCCHACVCHAAARKHQGAASAAGWLIFIENEQPVKSLWKHRIVERLRRDLGAAVGMIHHRRFFGNERCAAKEQSARLWSVPSVLPKQKNPLCLLLVLQQGLSWQVKCFPWSFYNRTFKCFPTMLNWWVDSLLHYRKPRFCALIHCLSGLGSEYCYWFQNNAVQKLTLVQ